MAVRAKPVDLASGLPSSQMHLRAINNALKGCRGRLEYVQDALITEKDHWPQIEDKVADCLACGTTTLEGALDGLVILESAGSPETGMSFVRTPFGDEQLQGIQNEVKGLRSPVSDTAERYADFWSIADFWKHYFPYQPRPSEFTLKLGGSGEDAKFKDIRDIRVNIGGSCDSGPLMYELIIPAFNGAVQIVTMLVDKLGLPGQDVVTSIVDKRTT